MFEKDIESVYDIVEGEEFLLQDMPRWSARLRLDSVGFEAFSDIFTTRQEFRSVLLYRLQCFGDTNRLAKFNSFLGGKANAFVTNLYISCKDIGPGFYIEHGYASIIYAHSIGNNFHLNQCVTIGAGSGGCPIIENNVSVHCNSVVLGNIVVRHNTTIAAGSVLVDSTPGNCTVASPKAVIVRSRA